jgi:U3 small nucleolar RNA-associated protein 10
LILQNKGILNNGGVGQALLPPDVLMQTMSIDHSVRAIGVRQILEHFGSVDSLEDMNDPFEQSKVAAIVDRMSDASEELQVLEAVYNTAPETLVRVIFWSSGTPGDTGSVIIDKIASALRTSNLTRAIVRLHLGFFAEHFIPQALVQRQGKLARYTLESLFLPFLLFSKPRQNTAFSVWEILGSSALWLSTPGRPSGDLDLLTGCIPIVKELSPKKSKLSVDEMVVVNASVCAKVAGEPMLRLE